MAGGWKAIIVMAHQCEGFVPTIKLFPRSGNRNALAGKLFLRLSYSLLEVFAWPDDDRCMSGLNRDAVDPSEARPDPTITCAWIFCFDCLSTACHCTYCRRPRLHRTPAMTAKIVAGSRGCRFRIFLSAASSLPICTSIWRVSSLAGHEICVFDRDKIGLSR